MNKSPKPQFMVIDGKRYVLKENGLPDGFNLYWQERATKERTLRYIYTKFNGRGLSTGTTDVREAVRFVERKRKNWEQNEHGISVDNLSINDLLDGYLRNLEMKNLARGEYRPKTAQITKGTLNKHVRPFFGGIKVAQLVKVPNKLDDYRKKRTVELCVKTGKSSDKVQYTIDHELGYVRTAFRLAAKKHQIPQSIIPVFDIDKANASKGARHGMFDGKQYDTLVERLPDHVKPVFAFCNWTAVRKKESTFVHRSEVNWDRRIVRLRQEETKAGKERFVPIPNCIWPIIWSWEERTRLEHQDAEYLFHLNGERMTPEQVTNAFNETCEQLKWHKPRIDCDGNEVRGKNGDLLYDRSPLWHDSRRTATTVTSNLEGLTNVDLQRTLGMTDQTKMRYDNTESAVKVRDALDRKHNDATGESQKAGFDVRTRLLELKTLHDDGLIDDSEFKEAKIRLLVS